MERENIGMKNKNRNFLYNLIAILFFFCFFESFAIINFGNLSINSISGFGLQFSWFIGSILLCLNIAILLKGNKIRIKEIYSSVVWEFYITLVVITILDYFFIGFMYDKTIEIDGILEKYSFDFSIYKSRSYVHLLYIVIIVMISRSVISLSKKMCVDDFYTLVKRWLITYPFIFICIWGIYQWITTFDIVPYVDIFNNSISTGFTYLRFKAEHRECSVFPEPSEYAFYLGFYLPLVFSFMIGKCNVFSIKMSLKNRIMIGGLYISQCILCGSFSLYVAFPIMLLLTINCIALKGKSKLKFNVIYLIVILMAFAVILLRFGDRVHSILAGTDLSALVRYNAFLRGIDLFNLNIYTGLGYGGFRAMDLTSGTLAYFGLVGTISFMIFVWRLYKLSSKANVTRVLWSGY